MKRVLGEKGFLLVEMLVAMTLLALLSIPVFNLFALALDVERRAGRETVALNLAREAMERARSEGFAAAGCLEEEVDGFSDFRREVLVEEIPGLQLQKITVVVSWQWREREEAFYLVSYLAKR